MQKYQVIEECSCSLKVLGEYDTFEEAEEAAALLEESGLKVKIQGVPDERK